MSAHRGRISIKQIEFKQQIEADIVEKNQTAQYGNQGKKEQEADQELAG